MDDAAYKEMLDQAKADYCALQEKMGECLKEQQHLEKRIVGIRETIVALSNLLGEEFVEEDALGLTDAIRQAFKTAVGPMAPTDVRGRLEQLGYDISKYGNVMASVHSVLNRLVQRREVAQEGTIGAKPAYRWTGSMRVRIATPSEVPKK